MMLGLRLGDKARPDCHHAKDHQNDCRHLQFAIRAPTFRYAVRKSPRNYTVRVLVHSSRLTPHVNWLAWRLKN